MNIKSVRPRTGTSTKTITDLEKLERVTGEIDRAERLLAKRCSTVFVSYVFLTPCARDRFEDLHVERR